MPLCSVSSNVVVFFFFNDTATPEIYTLSLHDALPIFSAQRDLGHHLATRDIDDRDSGLLPRRSEEHTSELQSPMYLVCRLLLEKKNKLLHEAQDSRLPFLGAPLVVQVRALCCALTCSFPVHSSDRWRCLCFVFLFFLNDPAPPETYPLPLPGALPI